MLRRKHIASAQRFAHWFYCLVVAVALLSDVTAGLAETSPWPPSTPEQRPWAYWWWLGSAVDKTNLSRELTRYHEAGYGGVHIIPIYGAKGWESNYIRYLSPQWMELLDYTVREANRLDLGVDMTTGSGWCFGGGPYVGEAEGNASVVLRTFELTPGGKLIEPLNRKATQALVAFPASGAAVELTSQIGSNGMVDWTAPADGAKVYAISQRFQGQKVKRSAPGGEGPMLNLIYPDAMPVFLRGFTEAFANYHGAKPRAQYHDSYEYKSDWAPDFFSRFAQRRGYRLQTELPALFGPPSEHSARVLADYRETVSDVIIEDSLSQWVQWSHQRGFITRNEAHGSPGNLLDLYALADVPETEMFRLDRNKLIAKFASSAAHVAGRKLVAAETGTWLKEHFTETLADMKYLVDDLFISGVNHVFYHGTCYSPDEAGWPGWLFYASYEMNPRNPVWHDARALNDYVARCQSILQSGQPASDILLYWPIHDFWQKAGPEPLLPHMTVHARAWFESQPIGALAEQLWQRGYAFDYVSDRQLCQALPSKHGITLPGGDYRVVLVPQCDFMPLPTLEKLGALANAGATVIFAGALPIDVPGLGDLKLRQQKFASLLATPKGEHAGKGLWLVGDVESALARAGVIRESLMDRDGLFYVRRATSSGRNYFIANRSEREVMDWLPLATTARAVELLDPMSGRSGLGAMRPSKTGTEVYCQLQPGESVIVRTHNQSLRGMGWRYWRPAPESELLVGAWKVEFLTGGPELPPSLTANSLGSWTTLGGAAAQSFAGTARYRLVFDAPAGGSNSWALDLGRVCQSARVKVNGQDYGILLTPPFRVVVNNLRHTGNELQVDVTSTAANRVRDLDQRGVSWRNFRDINFVNQDYQPFNAANWPLADCGLLGPVTVTAANQFMPSQEQR